MEFYSNWESNKWQNQQIKKKFKNRSCGSKASKVKNAYMNHWNGSVKQIPSTMIRGWIRGKVQRTGKQTKTLNRESFNLKSLQYESVQNYEYITYGDHDDDYDEEWWDEHWQPWLQKEKKRQKILKEKQMTKSAQIALSAYSSNTPSIIQNDIISNINYGLTPSPPPMMVEPDYDSTTPSPPPPRPSLPKKTLYKDQKYTRTEQEEKEYSALSDQYISAMDEIEEYGVYASIEGLSARSTYSSHQSDTADPTSANFKLIMKEIKKALPKNLYCSLNGSMFVRFDEGNPRFLQALLTGIEDTPYESGCFLFDIYLCDDYPQKPLMIKHVTKGAPMCHANNGPGGFSPNLHQSSGKVCLSLLGTWSGPGWEAGKSNVYQVISTIMFMIFGADHPYYMEPNHGGWEGTVQGRTEHERRVIDYDEEVIYHNCKYAMLETMKAPYPGFEEVIKAHFKTKKALILRMIERWMENENHTETFKAKMKPVVEEIKKEFEKLK